MFQTVGAACVFAGCQLLFAVAPSHVLTVSDSFIFKMIHC